MPADTIRKQPPKGKGSGLNKKLGPLPVWGWGVGFVLAVAVGLYLRQKSANSAAGSPATAAAPSADSGAGGVGGASSDPNTAQGIDTTGLSDAINNLGYVLGGGGGILSAGGSTLTDPGFAPTPAPVSGASSAPAPVASTSGASGVHSSAPKPSPAAVPFSAPGSRPGETLNLSTGIASLASGQKIVGPQRTPPSDVNPGNVVGFKVLPSGATLTTLSSGRQIEQAPGKSPYVVHK